MEDVIAKDRGGRRAAYAGNARYRAPVTATVDLSRDELEPSLTAWEKMDGRVRLILARDGRLIAASCGAPAMLTHHEQSGCPADMARFNTVPWLRQLQSILTVAEGKLETVVVPKRSGEDGHYIISAIGISEDAVAVAVREADTDFITVLAGLEQAFGLTPSETLVIEKLMQGLVPQDIAEALDISVHTVRAHLRHCYGKLHVSSREELWQRLAPYRLN